MNLSQIGQAVRAYAAENGGRFPDRFEDLLLTQDITSELFVCASSQDERAQGQTVQEQAANLSKGGHLSYVYAGRGLNSSSPDDAIVAYENPRAHNNDGMNFLYADGHVEFQNRWGTDHLLAELAAGHNPPRAAKGE